MDQATQTAINQLASQIQALQSQFKQGPPESIFAPSGGSSYVVPGPRDFYSYTQRATSLASGATTSLTYQIEADSYFYMNALMYQVDEAAADVTYSTNPLGLITVVLFDSGSGRQLMANPTPLSCIMGDGRHPFRLPKPRRIAPTAQITATLVNYSASTTYNVSICLSGFKVYSQMAITTNGPVGQ
jgi:hypothetical protein